MRRERGKFGNKEVLSLDQKLADLRRESKDKFTEMKDREMDFFMTPGQKKREAIRRGKRRAKMDRNSSHQNFDKFEDT